MAKLSKNLDFFLRNIGAYSEFAFAPIPKSSGFISPGDILFFEYPDDNGKNDFRIVLVVASKYGQGIYTAKTGNKLLTCFKLDEPPFDVVRIILYKLYKNKELCSYDTITYGLNAILGEYRTYNLAKIELLHKLEFDQTKLVELEDGE